MSRARRQRVGVPRLAKGSVDEKLRMVVLEATSSDALREVACACCGELKLEKRCEDMPLSQVDLDFGL